LIRFAPNQINEPPHGEYIVNYSELTLDRSACVTPLKFSPPPAAWAIANDPPERTRECSLIGITASYGDIAYRKVGSHQQRFRVINPAFKEKTTVRHAEALPECAREVTYR
jgi:hypothetical protein